VFSTGAWATYTPTWTASTTNPTIGNGTLQGRYLEIGSAVFGEIRVVFGSTSTRGSGTYAIALPFASNGINYQPMGQVVIRDASTAELFMGTVLVDSSDFANLKLYMHSQEAVYDEGIGATEANPVFFENGDSILITFMYEKAGA
jgi:hypothetical protein